MATLQYYCAAVNRLWGAAALTKTASESSLATSNADWLPDSDVLSRVKDAIAELFGYLADALGNSDRTQLLTTKLGIPHGQLLEDSYLPHLGQVSGIRVTFGSDVDDTQYQSAQRDDVRAIEAYRDDRTNSEVDLDLFSFDLIDGRLYHSGAFASCEYVPAITDYNAAAGLVPDRYNGLVIALAARKLAILIAPSRVSGAQSMTQLAQEGIAALMQNQAGPTEADVREAASYEGT